MDFGGLEKPDPTEEIFGLLSSARNLNMQLLENVSMLKKHDHDNMKTMLMEMGQVIDRTRHLLQVGGKKESSRFLAIGRLSKKKNLVSLQVKNVAKGCG